MKYMVSACLMGVNCKYSGGHNRQDALVEFMKDKEYLCVCPEQLGGLPTPRACCEIVQDKVTSQSKEDVSEQYLLGAQRAAQLAVREHVDCVITQPRSPSCGKGKIYDGSFQGKLIKGNGWFVEKLLEKKILVEDYEHFYENTIKKPE